MGCMHLRHEGSLPLKLLPVKVHLAGIKVVGRILAFLVLWKVGGGGWGAEYQRVTQALPYDVMATGASQMFRWGHPTCSMYPGGIRIRTAQPPSCSISSPPPAKHEPSCRG